MGLSKLSIVLIVKNINPKYLRLHMEDYKELAKFFPITMSEVQKREGTKTKNASEPNPKKVPLTNEDQMISMFKKRMENLALAKASEERQNLKLETKEEILSEIKKAVQEETQSKQKAEDVLVKKAIEGEDIEPKEELVDSRARILSELKSIYHSELT